MTAPGWRGVASIERLAFALALVLALSLGARSARAQPRPPPPQSASGSTSTDSSPAQQRAAQQLFEAASRDRDAGLLTRAEERLRQALPLWDHLVIRYNLALVLIERDAPVEAAAHLREVIARGPREPGIEPSMIEHAEKKLQALLERQLGNVVVVCRRTGAQVFIDNRRAFTVGATRGSAADPHATSLRQDVRAGDHLFVAMIPGEAPVVVWRSIAAGETLHVELAATAAHERRWPGMSWEPWAVAAGGAAIWAAGFVLQGRADASYLEFELALNKCWRHGASCDPNDHIQLRDRGDTLKRLGIISYAIAGATIATGGVLAYLNRRRPEGRTAGAAQKRSRARYAASIAPLVGPGTGGAVLLGRF